MCRGAAHACACTLPIPVVFGAFMAITNCVSPGLCGLAAASTNRVTKRWQLTFTLQKAKNKKAVTNLARQYGIYIHTYTTDHPCSRAAMQLWVGCGCGRSQKVTHTWSPRTLARRPSTGASPQLPPPLLPPAPAFVPPPAAADAGARGCPPSLLRVPSSGRGACWAAPGQRDPFASAQWRAGEWGVGSLGWAPELWLLKPAAGQVWRGPGGTSKANPLIPGRQVARTRRGGAWQPSSLRTE
jgi:hypothetical protein